MADTAGTWRDADPLALDLKGSGPQDGDDEAILEIALVPLRDGQPNPAGLRSSWNTWQIVEADLLGLDGDFEPVDAVWTSCSWHYSVNHHRPLAELVAAMQTRVRAAGGLFGAEYMIPVEPRHFGCEHYPDAGQDSIRGATEPVGDAVTNLDAPAAQ